MIRSLLAGLLICLPGLCASALAQHHGGPSPAVIGELGEVEFPNSGAKSAQQDFLRGVLLLHSFEFDAARSSFLAAQANDRGFALAYWGEALSHNRPIWGEQDLEAARAALRKLAATTGERRARAPTAREKDYLASVELLFGEGDKRHRDASYSAALGEMARRYPEDLEARTLYALSLMGLTGATRDTANYMRAAAEAEAAHLVNPRHPGALHYLIHAYDDPVHAPLGIRAARAYGQVARAASHAQHMPSHIFFALGIWNDAIAANVASMKTARDQGHGGYHPLEWLTYAYLQVDRRDDARKLVELVAADVAERPERRDSRDALAYVRATWLVETGGAEAPGVWDRVDSEGIVSLASFPAHDFARGLVAARQDRVEQAEAALALLRQRTEVARQTPVKATIADRFDAVTPEQIAQAEVLIEALQGAVAFAKGGHEEGVARLRQAIAQADRMAFEYGPPWSVKPLDELLGEMLLSLGRKEEAAAAFEKALQVHPKRRLSVAGLRAARPG